MTLLNTIECLRKFSKLPQKNVLAHHPRFDSIVCAQCPASVSLATVHIPNPPSPPAGLTVTNSNHNQNPSSGFGTYVRRTDHSAPLDRRCVVRPSPAIRYLVSLVFGSVLSETYTLSSSSQPTHDQTLSLLLQLPENVYRPA
jgi:hypothetical protein